MPHKDARTGGHLESAQEVTSWLLLFLGPDAADAAGLAVAAALGPEAAAYEAATDPAAKKPATRAARSLFIG